MVLIDELETTLWMSVTTTGADSSEGLMRTALITLITGRGHKSGRRLSSPAGGLYRDDVYWRQGASLVKKSAKEPQHRAFCLASETEGVLRKDRTGINNLSHHIRRIVHQAILSFPSLCKFVWFWDYLVLPYRTLGNRGEGGSSSLHENKKVNILPEMSPFSCCYF